MNEGTAQVIRGLRAAMQAERTGHEFYKLAAQTTEDPAGRATFERLAKEEHEHFEFLRRHYQSLLKDGRLAQGEVLPGRSQVDPQSPIFSASLRARIKEAHFEMSALAIALQLELNGIEHYRALAHSATIPEARKFFEELVEWESVHYEALVRQQRELQEEYWQDAGFDPF